MNEQPFDKEDQHLQPAWLALEQRLQAAEMVKPRPGFSRRWLARYTAQPAKEPRMLLLGVANVTATLTLFALLLPGIRPLFAEPGSLLAGVAEWGTRILSAVVVISKTVTSVVNVIPAAAWLVIGSSGLALLAIAALLFSKVPSFARLVASKEK